MKKIGFQLQGLFGWDVFFSWQNIQFPHTVRVLYIYISDITYFASWCYITLNESVKKYYIHVIEGVSQDKYIVRWGGIYVLDKNTFIIVFAAMTIRVIMNVLPIDDSLDAILPSIGSVQAMKCIYLFPGYSLMSSWWCLKCLYFLWLEAELYVMETNVLEMKIRQTNLEVSSFKVIENGPLLKIAFAWKWNRTHKF